MAITPGVQAGKTPYQIAGATGAAPLRLGASAYIATPTASATVTLPVDPQGNAYAAYLITASGNIWWGFGSGPATVGGANEFLVGPGSQLPVVAPPGSTQVSAIFDTASTTGGLCIVGLY